MVEIYTMLVFKGCVGEKVTERQIESELYTGKETE
jgi:hypothetical protein